METLIPRELPESYKTKGFDKVVLGVSTGIVFLFVIWGIWLPGSFEKTINRILSFFTTNFDWSYLLIANGFVLFCLWLAFSRFGKIKLGKPEDKPEYTLLEYWAMLFSVGMGIGVLFWGVAEPLYHYFSPPYGIPKSPDSALLGMRYAFFHWGIHPWAIYSVTALPVAYFSYKYDLPCLISTVLYPLFKEKIWGTIGKVIDSLAIFATIGGVVTSIGLGALQISRGLNFAFKIPISDYLLLAIIVASTFLFILSAVRGVKGGIRIFSEASFWIGVALMVWLFVLGPARFILQMLVQAFGEYIQNFIPMSFFTDPIRRSGWPGRWTVFYWAWWIAWAPFVGPFFAKISKGRTIREFILSTLIFPTFFDILWFAVFGGTGLYLEIFKNTGIAATVQKDVATSLFFVLKQYPLYLFWAIAAVIAACSFYVNSADAAVFTAGMLSEKGTLEPSNVSKYIWGILSGGAAAVMVIRGGLSGLQTASIVAAFPFMIIMVLMCVSFAKVLMAEEKKDGT